jgi:drug/metabolite transporter (DMT)-like permease
MTSSRLTPLALGATAILWASAFPAIKIGLAGHGVAGLSFLRLFVAAVALAAVAPLMKVRRPGARDLPLIAVCGATGMAAYQVLLNWGEVHVPAGTASLIIAVAPVFSVLLAAAFLVERMTVRTGVGSAVAIGGSAMIALSGGDAGYSTAAWVVLAAAVAQGVYHFATKPLLQRYSAVEVACYATWAGTLFLAPLAPGAVVGALGADLGSNLAVVFLGVFPSAIGFVVWGYAVSRSSVSGATAVLYLVPVVAVAVSFVALAEVPTPAEIVGGVIGIVGVVVIRGAGHAAVRKTGQPISVRHSDASGVSRGPTR